LYFLWREIQEAWIKSYCRLREISSLTGLIQVFLKNWDPTYEEDQDDMMMKILVNHLVTPLKTMYIKRLLMKGTQASMSLSHEVKGFGKQ
jgi:hypothetical protein